MDFLQQLMSVLIIAIVVPLVVIAALNVHKIVRRNIAMRETALKHELTQNAILLIIRNGATIDAVSRITLIEDLIYRQDHPYTLPD